jgi:hypothetical protein
MPADFAAVDFDGVRFAGFRAEDVVLLVFLVVVFVVLLFRMLVLVAAVLRAVGFLAGDFLAGDFLAAACFEAVLPVFLAVLVFFAVPVFLAGDVFFAVLAFLAGDVFFAADVFFPVGVLLEGVFPDADPGCFAAVDDLRVTLDVTRLAAAAVLPAICFAVVRAIDAWPPQKPKMCGCRHTRAARICRCRTRGNQTRPIWYANSVLLRDVGLPRGRRNGTAGPRAPPGTRPATPGNPCGVHRGLLADLSCRKASTGRVPPSTATSDLGTVEAQGHGRSEDHPRAAGRESAPAVAQAGRTGRGDLTRGRSGSPGQPRRVVPRERPTTAGLVPSAKPATRRPTGRRTDP